VPPHSAHAVHAHHTLAAALTVAAHLDALFDPHFPRLGKFVAADAAVLVGVQSLEGGTGIAHRDTLGATFAHFLFPLDSPLLARFAQLVLRDEPVTILVHLREMLSHLGNRAIAGHGLGHHAMVLTVHRWWCRRGSRGLGNCNGTGQHGRSCAQDPKFHHNLLDQSGVATPRFLYRA
jgi:hypothetical protein